MPIEAAPTVRDTITAALETHVPEEASVPAPENQAPPLGEAAKPQAPAQETEEQKAERLRNKDGTFAKGKPEQKVEAKPAEAPKPKVPRPSSWKKELESHWDTLQPEVQAYVGERERQYATGVSTYKTEADRAKSVMTALAEIEPVLQQGGIAADKWVASMGQAHRVLAQGTAQDKVSLLQQVIANNRIPVQLAYQDQQGRWQLIGQQQPAQQQAAQQQLSPQDIEATVQKAVDERLVNEKVSAEYKAFTEAKDEAGNPKYPYFEELKATMAGILQAELAQTLAEAHEAALRHPKHADLFEAVQKQQATTKEAERVKTAQSQATRARSQAVSVKSSTPTAMTPAPKAQGLRDQLTEAFDTVTTRRV